VKEAGRIVLRPQFPRRANPRTTSSEIVQTLNKEINSAIADPKTKAGFADLKCLVWVISVGSQAANLGGEVRNAP
jgi:hypothetical protein